MGNNEFDKETIEIIKNIVKKQEELILEKKSCRACIEYPRSYWEHEHENNCKIHKIDFINQNCIIALKNVIYVVERHGVCDIKKIAANRFHDYECDLYFIYQLLRLINQAHKLEKQLLKEEVGPDRFGRIPSWHKDYLFSKIEINALEKTLSVVDPDDDEEDNNKKYEYRNEFKFEEGFYQFNKDYGFGFSGEDEFPPGENEESLPIEYYEIEPAELCDVNENDLIPDDPKKIVVFSAYFYNRKQDWDVFYKYTNENCVNGFKEVYTSNIEYKDEEYEYEEYKYDLDDDEDEYEEYEDDLGDDEE